MTCDQCGSDNPTGQKYCGQCGAPLDSLAAPTRAAIAASVRQEVSKALAGYVKDQRMAEFDVTEKVTDRLIGWSKIAGLFVGIFLAGAGYLGFQSFKDVLDSFKKELQPLQNKAKASSDELQTQITTAKGIVDSLNAQSSTIREQLAQMEKQEGPLRDKLARLDDRVAKMDVDNKTQINDLKSQVSQLDTAFRELPKATGAPPYHLRLEDVNPVGSGAPDAQGTLIFQATGDTGGVLNPAPQLKVADAMATQFSAPGASEKPAFLYLLGDLIYYNGEKEHYYDQFYAPYAHYPAPIFAIPGNHDGENLQADTSLSAFIANFCAPTAVHRAEAASAARSAMTQPNSYWTLETKQATIIGLYTNVPEGGEIHEDQQDWLVHELETAPTDKALILALHHPPVYFSGSRGSNSVQPNIKMLSFLEQAFNKAHRVPNAILSAHVNNYQRIDVELSSKLNIPFFIIGTGGYHNLRRLTPQGAGHLKSGRTTLMAGIDDKYGFVAFEVSQNEIKGRFMALSKALTNADAIAADEFAYSAKPILLANGQTIALGNIGTGGHP